MKRPKKTWAESEGLRQGKLNDVVDGIKITEDNRATVYELRRAGIQELLDYQRKNYTEKGVRSVIYGVRLPIPTLKGQAPKMALTEDVYYAIYCQNGFITNVT